MLIIVVLLTLVVGLSAYDNNTAHADTGREKGSILRTSWPRPTNTHITPVCDGATLKHVPYNILWTIEPREQLIRLTVSVALGPKVNSSSVVTMSSSGYAVNVTVPLDYDKHHFTYCYATYHCGANCTSNVVGPIIDFETTEGLWHPVRNLRPSQDGFTERVKLVWDPPRGCRTHYLVRIMDEDGVDVQPGLMLDHQATCVTITIVNPQFGSAYKFAVTRVQLGFKGKKILGGTSIEGLNLRGRKPKFQPWKIVLTMLAAGMVIVSVTAYCQGFRANF